jgi:hypothetical protein
VTAAESDIYDVTAVDGILTVVSAGKITDIGRTLSLDGKIFINQYVTVEGFEGIDIENAGGLLIWYEPVDAAEAVFGTEDTLKATLIGHKHHNQVPCTALARRPS